ncbi:MAG: glycosyltransferase family 2 protein [candidate division WOR-3 bacterium]
MLEVSIVIVTYKSESDIRDCLLSLPRGEDCEIIVIDNASGDKTPEIIRKEFPWVKLIVNKKNLGYAKANNQGIGLSRGKYIFLLNPDTRVKEDSLRKMVRFMEENSLVSVLAPKMLNLNGTIQDSIREFPDYKILFWEVTGLSRLFPKSPIFGRWRLKGFDYTKIQEIPQPMTSALLFRREVFEQVGLFDEDFPIYYNDVDLLKRIKDKGLKVLYFPYAEVIHKRGATTKIFWGRMIFEQHKSMYQYFKKYKKGKFLYPFFLFTAIIRFFAYKVLNSL